MNHKTVISKLLAMLTAAIIMLSGGLILPETNLPDIPTEPPVVEPGEIGDNETDEPNEGEELDPMCEAEPDDIGLNQ